MDFSPAVAESVTILGNADRLGNRAAQFLRRRFPGRLEMVLLYLAIVVVFTVFGVSTIPGVRHKAGYNLFLDGVLNNLAYELSAALCFLRGRRTFTFRASWRVLAVGLALYGLGNIYWTIFVGNTGPMPSPADGFWLSFYICAFVALLLVIKEFAERLPLSLWLDGIVGGLAVAAIAAAAVGPVLRAAHSNGDSTPAIITTEAYPLLDILLLLVVTALLALHHWRPPAGLWFLAGGLAMFAVADVVYLVLSAHQSYQPGGLDDYAWVLATLLMGFAPGWSKRAAGAHLPAWLLLGIPVGASLCAVALLV
jgi:hypothetical protein